MPAKIRMTEETATPRAESCFIIATWNRHDYLVEAVRSLVRQTVLPAELCIVDSSDETPARAEIEELCAAAGIRLDYVHPAPRGLTIQRNIGIDRTTGDPVFLIDDDVVLAEDVHEEILAEFGRWGPELGGVRGAPVFPPDPGRATILWRKFFGMGGWWPEGSGRVRAGFFVEGVASSESVRRVEHFNGWFMSFRREVFEHERFDENLAGYAFKEDADFTYRVSKRGYVLVQTPKAKIHHHKTQVRAPLAVRPPAHGHGEPVLPAPQEHAPDAPLQGSALVGPRRRASAERRQGRAEARPRLPDRIPGRRLGTGAWPGPDRPGRGERAPGRGAQRVALRHEAHALRSSPMRGPSQLKRVVPRLRRDSSPAFPVPRRPPGTARASMFFDEYPRFYETSETRGSSDRLNLRYEAIIAENVDALSGAQVLDIASHDGRWSFAALKSGAAGVVGIEAREERVRTASENLAHYGVDAGRYRFIAGDVYTVLAREAFEADVVLCLGFLYHTLRYNELMHRIRGLGARYLIIDTVVVPEEPRPVIQIKAEPVTSTAADPFSHEGKKLVGRPSIPALEVVLASYGYAIERYSDWGSLLRDNPALSEMGGYNSGLRITARCVSVQS